MTATEKPLYIEQGATFNLGFFWHRADPEDSTKPGEPYDLTGWSARMQIRKSLNSPVILEASTENGKIVLNSSPGRVQLKFTDEDTMLLVSRTAGYDLELTSPSGDVERLLQGPIEVDLNFTRDAE